MNRNIVCLFCFLYPLLNKVEGRYTGFTLSIRLSVCGQNCVRPVSSTILARSISYLHISSSNFRMCVVCKIFFNIKIIESFGKFFKFVTLTLSCFDLGSNMSWSIVWVIMGQRGYPQNGGVPVVLIFVGVSVNFLNQLVVKSRMTLLIQFLSDIDFVNKH